jgi:hypothetical protein
MACTNDSIIKGNCQRGLSTYRNTCFRIDNGAEGDSQSAGFLGNLANFRTILAQFIFCFTLSGNWEKERMDGGRMIGGGWALNLGVDDRKFCGCGEKLRSWPPRVP